MNRLIHVPDKGTSSFPLYSLLYISEPIPIIHKNSKQPRNIKQLMSASKDTTTGQDLLIQHRILGGMCLSIMSNKL